MPNAVLDDDLVDLVDGSLTGSKVGTGINAAYISTGLLPNGRISGTYSSAVTFSNASNSFTGSFTGNGSGLTGLPTGPWNTSGSNIYFNTGLVGIGVSSPTYPLIVSNSSGSYTSSIYASKSGNTGGSYAIRGVNSSIPNTGSVANGGSFTANGNAAGLKYGVQGIASGTGSQNIGGAFTGSGATRNYGVYAQGDYHYFNGNVGIGQLTAPYPLTIVPGTSSRCINIDHNQTAASSTYSVLVDLDQSGSALAYGVHSSATNTGGSSNTFALYGRADGTSTGTKYGVYASASGSGTLWAGYFAGNVYTNGRLGIGDASPSYPLSISPGTNTRGIFIDHNQTAGGWTYCIDVDLDNTYSGDAVTTGIRANVLKDNGTYDTNGLWAAAQGNSTGPKTGVYGLASGSGIGRGVYGYSDVSGTRYAIYGVVSNSGYPIRYGVYASCNVASGSTANYGGYFLGNLHSTGTNTKSASATKIDHPLDPKNKYLYHSSVESPDMMNVYNGNVILDKQGEAWIDLPNYFDAYNKDFRYQLTCIGGFAQVYIAEKISNNSFKIAGGKPGLEVSWQVTGIRHDLIAEQNRIVVEVNKTGEERGKYQNPEVYGMPNSEGIGYREEPSVDEE